MNRGGKSGIGTRTSAGTLPDQVPLLPKVVAVSGRTGTGKTTTASLAAARLNWRHVSFGDFVRSVADARGMPHTRRNLQDLGAELVGEGMAEFCRAVLTHGGWQRGDGAIVDGIRHVAAVESLRRAVFPQELLHVHLEASERARDDRLDKRGDAVSADDEDHPVETEVASTLPGVADAVVPADGSVQSVVRFLLAELAAHGGPAGSEQADSDTGRPTPPAGSPRTSPENLPR